MSIKSSKIVLSWIEAANNQDVALLADLSDPNIEIVGPRGSGYGTDLLRDWLTRAGLVLESKRVFAKGNAVVVEQHGKWHSVETGEFIGEADVASRFEIEDDKVKTFERFDNLNAALNSAGLTETDKVIAV